MSLFSRATVLLAAGGLFVSSSNAAPVIQWTPKKLEVSVFQGGSRSIKLKKDSRLTLSGGIYNLSSLELEKTSKLIYASPTIVNIKSELTGDKNVAILPSQNLKPNDLVINYAGVKSKSAKKASDQSNVKEIHFKKDSFLNFKLLAPQAKVVLGQNVTLRGQVLAQMIIVGQESILSREETFEKESDPEKVVEDEDGVRFIGNELIVLFEDSASEEDVQTVVHLVNGVITGFDPDPPAYKIELPTNSVAGMQAAINTVLNANNPSVIEVIPNIITSL